MHILDEERIGESDKVLVIITNQYMFEQLLWYRTKYPEGIWDALIIRFGVANDNLMDIMYKKCFESGMFRRVVCYGYRMPENSLFKKIFMMFQYVCQYITKKREKSDKKLIEKIVGRSDYKKVIIHYTHDLIPVAAVNAMSDSVLVCLEDGMSDYLPVRRIRYWKELVNYMLAKMNIANVKAYGHQYQLKYDSRLIKYCSLPDKMQYRNYKMIKQLFEDDNRKIEYSEKELLLAKENYELVVFLTAFSDYGDNLGVYDLLHSWLVDNYSGKKILVKPHPREPFRFQWDDLDVQVGGEEMAGEILLDLVPDAELLFMFPTTIIIKAYRENRSFKVICFPNLKLKSYEIAIKSGAEILGFQDENWIILGK